MGILSGVLKPFGLILFLALAVDGGEYCYNDGRSEYCSGYCCSSESDNCCSDWGWIAGVVVGAIVFIAIVGTIVFLVCQKMNAKKSRTVHVQMSNYDHHSYQTSHRNTRRQANVNNNQTMFTTNMAGNTLLPPPPPYSQTYTPNPAYPPPPPYPGSPHPGSNMFSAGNNAYPSTQTQMTSHTQNTGDIAYPPPPVS